MNDILIFDMKLYHAFKLGDFMSDEIPNFRIH